MPTRRDNAARARFRRGLHAPRANSPSSLVGRVRASHLDGSRAQRTCLVLPPRRAPERQASMVRSWQPASSRSCGRLARSDPCQPCRGPMTCAEGGTRRRASSRRLLEIAHCGARASTPRGSACCSRLRAAAPPPVSTRSSRTRNSRGTTTCARSSAWLRTAAASCFVMDHAARARREDRSGLSRHARRAVRRERDREIVPHRRRRGQFRRVRGTKPCHQREDCFQLARGAPRSSTPRLFHAHVVLSARERVPGRQARNPLAMHQNADGRFERALLAIRSAEGSGGRAGLLAAAVIPPRTRRRRSCRSSTERQSTTRRCETGSTSSCFAADAALGQAAFCREAATGETRRVRAARRPQPARAPKPRGACFSHRMRRFPHVPGRGLRAAHRCPVDTAAGSARAAARKKRRRIEGSGRRGAALRGRRRSELVEDERAVPRRCAPWRGRSRSAGRGTGARGRRRARGSGGRARARARTPSAARRPGCRGTRGPTARRRGARRRARPRRRAPTRARCR